MSLLEILIEEITDRLSNGERPKLSEYLALYPECADGLNEYWDVIMTLQHASEKSDVSVDSPVHSGHPSERLDFLHDPIAADVSGMETEELERRLSEKQEPRIGRYTIVRQIGQGGFGVVLLAVDDQLDRSVAIKLPHLHRMQNASTSHLYVQEAKMLAQLDHPAVVPIYDCGVIPDGRCFVVSKYIEGEDLAQLMRSRRLAPQVIAELMVTVAEALEYVHRLNIVHRDIKPANLLIGSNGRAYVADFGLAMRDAIMDSKQPLAGTLRYMSPELLRREGHRIDGRSDQFSLGVVLYELLTMKSPFVGNSCRAILKTILEHTPPEPSELEPQVPTELSRICMKMLSKLASQRYASMHELANELKQWIRDGTASGFESPTNGGLSGTNMFLDKNHPKSFRSDTVSMTPRGLRAFSREDAGFFVRLLPGPRSRDGVPISIGQWQRWIDCDDLPDELRRVGVISGPTGCGKSSFVRAGLIPTLGPDVVTVIVDASGDKTEEYLIHAFRHVDKPSPLKHEQSFVAENSSGVNLLADRIAQIRRDKQIGRGKKLLIVIDQFEQWLHTHPDPIDTPLVEAIRQCDGHSVQCLILVRDDFWLGLNRFADAVEAPIQMGRNAMMVDLFDRSHSIKVLADFGRAYGKLPSDNPSALGIGDSISNSSSRQSLSRDQERFIEGAIDNLSREGKVIPVHLALFVEIVKSREWTVATLRELGGTIGIGAQFLMESFTVKYAPANQKAQEQAARDVLAALLPPLGTDIKACQKTRNELQCLSGLENNPSAFESLLLILESDLKLISPTDSLDPTRSDWTESGVEDSTFQLSHDFLVPSIREWLSSTLRQTWRGRLMQRLDEQSRLWVQNPEPRFLPNMVEGAAMRCFLPKRTMTRDSVSMLALRDRRSLIQLVTATVLGAMIFAGVDYWLARQRGNALVTQLMTADASMVPEVLTQLSSIGHRASIAAANAAEKAEPKSREKLLLQMAQLQWSSEPADDVFKQVVGSNMFELIPVAIEVLRPHRQSYVDQCWHQLESNPKMMVPELSDGESIEQRRVRLGQFLSAWDPPSADNQMRWLQIMPGLSQSLIHECTVHPDRFGLFADSFRPIERLLREPLASIVGSDTENASSRFAISLLARLTRDDLEYRTRIGLGGVDWQRTILLPSLDQTPIKVLEAAISGENPNHQAAAACLLFKLVEKNDLEDRQDIWNMLRRSRDNTCRTELIAQLSQAKLSERRLLRQLSSSADAGIVSASLMILGEIASKGRKPSDATRKVLLDVYREHPDAGVHSAALWCLRQCNATSAELYLKPKSEIVSQNRSDRARQWSIDPNGQLMLRIVIDTALPDSGRNGCDVWVAATEVTVAQFRRYQPDKYIAVDFSPSPDCPANVVTWPQAVAYCNWLSEQHGLPPFYPTDREELMRWRATPEILKKPGYRLPTAREWLVAASGGSETDLHFGSNLQMILRYDWLQENSQNEVIASRSASIEKATKRSGYEFAPSQPVGSLRPNEFGLFDVYSNVVEWTSDVGGSNANEREVRGLSVGAILETFYQLQFKSGSHAPLVEYNSLGLRVVRTCETENE